MFIHNFLLLLPLFAPIVPFVNAFNQTLEEYSAKNYSKLMLLGNFDIIKRGLNLLHDENCKNAISVVLNGIENELEWALKFYDSINKFPEGILSGSNYQLGNFDECLNIFNVNQLRPMNIKSKYCLSEITINLPHDYTFEVNSVWNSFKNLSNRYDNNISKLYWGNCVPNICDSQDIQRLIKYIINQSLTTTKLTVDVAVEDARCYATDKNVNFHIFEIIYIAVISSFVLLVIVGTVYHVILMRNNHGNPTSKLAQALIAFSIVLNLKKLNQPSDDNDLHLNSILGIKFIAMGFIVAGHCLVFSLGGPILNREFWTEAVGKVENSVFLNNPLLVDTFLFLSGFLFSRILLHELDKRKSINFFLLYIVRYIRLTPAYLVIIGFYITWLPRLSSGPLWYRIIEEKERCEISWWTNIIYINNYIHTDKLCMFQSWYLSVDTQLFIVAPAVIYPLWRWRKSAEFFIIIITIVSVFIPFIVTLVNQLDPTLMIYLDEIKDISANEYFKNYYIKTHMRASPYFIGIIFGYMLYRIQTSDYKISKSFFRFGSILAGLLLILSMTSINIFYVVQRKFTSFDTAIYNALHRFLWCLGTGWVVLASVTYSSGTLGTFLKWKAFIPFSRLTYAAYLVNGIVELYSAASVRTPQYLSVFDLFGKVMAHMVITFCGALVLSMVFEAPILGIERIFLRPKIKVRDNPNSSQSQTTETFSTSETT